MFPEAKPRGTLKLEVIEARSYSVTFVHVFTRISDGESNLQVAGRRSQVVGRCFTNTGSILNILKS